MQLCFFDDENASNFLPLTLTRPIYDLRVGILTVREKWNKWLRPKNMSSILTPHLRSVFASPDIIDQEDCIWINSRLLPSKPTVESINKLALGEGLYYKNTLLACRNNGVQSLSAFRVDSIPQPNKSTTATSPPILITFFWDMLHLNGEEIGRDIELMRLNPIKQKAIHSSVIITNPDQVYVADSARIDPGVIIMADEGPVFIGNEAKIEAGSVIKGPVAICEGAQVKMKARISTSTTIGPVCKAGGEINNCIFHSYSNKSHNGYAGNSIFGQWCNLAAGTITSNLKTNYGPIKIPHWDSGALSEDSVQFFGTVFGDFSKTAIQTKINVGTICGVSSNIFVSGFTPKKISSFTWLGDDGPKEYDFPKAIEAMRAMMARRDVDLDNDYIQMMKAIFASRSPS
ncbi:MAG: putative sugar nucleotidyl transferase [bacterium]|nr:putative sugar nucleotidyl transferase [bacterium]